MIEILSRSVATNSHTDLAKIMGMAVRVPFPPQKSLDMPIERFFASLMLKTQSLILGDWHDVVDDNGIVFDDNMVHQ
ncbi:MAG: hypothetical protein PVF74_15030 [Anaerolineales bacterium]|jgi:hypothetical protein